jgi:hypothetical protein
MISIYHITHIHNLPGIIKAGGLWCDEEVYSGRVAAIGIAHEHIKERRRRRNVDIAPGGNLSNYVPFYFAPRPPMLYAIHKGYVEGYQGGQDHILHLVTQIELIVQRGLRFVFSDGHAEMAISKFYNDLDRLDVIDWKVMKSNWWNDTLEYPDRKRRRQAEYLVKTFLPWDLITKIGVRLVKTQAQVKAIIEQNSEDHYPIIEQERGWYY